MNTVIPDLPIKNSELKALFDFLDAPNPEPCTHTFKLTSLFLKEHKLEIDPMLKWLGENGAGCDCEVIMNVDAQWSEAVGRD